MAVLCIEDVVLVDNARMRIEDSKTEVILSRIDHLLARVGAIAVVSQMKIKAIMEQLSLISY